MDDLLIAEMQRQHLPAVAVAVARGDQVMKSSAYGQADLETATAATPDTVFQIQSITKTFTSTAILQLVEKGQLSLEDPVSKHLNGTPEAWKDITLRHLLTHTSGIKDFINDPTSSLRIEVTEDEVLRTTADRPLNFPPGEGYQYSNTNYHLLAMILRRHTGQWYAEVLQDRHFRPLGMTHTRPVTLTALVPGRAAGYGWTGSEYRRGEFVAESILSYGGGGILSTAPDMARWAIAMLEGKVLEQTTLERAWTPTRLNNGTATDYGLGWGVSRVAGHREIGHNGGHLTGFSSSLVIFPEDRMAVVVLANRSGANLQAIARSVAGVYLPELAAASPHEFRDDDPATTAAFREILVSVADQWLQRDKFTPEVWAVLEARRESIQAQARGFGTLQKLDLLSRREADGRRTSEYRARFEHATMRLILGIDADGRIAELQSEDE